MADGRVGRYYTDLPQNSCTSSPESCNYFCFTEAENSSPGFGATPPPCERHNYWGCREPGELWQLIHFVESTAQHFGTSQRQVSDKMPDTPISGGVVENLLGQARTKEVRRVANVAGIVRETCFRELHANHD